MADEIMTFDEILADPVYKAEFDRRITKAIATVQKKLEAEIEKSKKYEGLDIEGLKKELDDLKNAEAERKDKEEADKKEKANAERFAAVLGDKKFTSDYARDGVYRAFVSAIADPANVGKGDADLFKTLTKDKDGIFQSANPPANMGKVGNSNHAGKTKAEILAIKDTAERQAAMVENHELFGF